VDAYKLLLSVVADANKQGRLEFGIVLKKFLTNFSWNELSSIKS